MTFIYVMYLCNAISGQCVIGISQASYSSLARCHQARDEAVYGVQKGGKWLVRRAFCRFGKGTREKDL